MVACYTVSVWYTSVGKDMQHAPVISRISITTFSKDVYSDAWLDSDQQNIACKLVLVVDIDSGTDKPKVIPNVTCMSGWESLN